MVTAIEGFYCNPRDKATPLHRPQLHSPSGVLTEGVVQESGCGLKEWELVPAGGIVTEESEGGVASTNLIT